MHRKNKIPTYDDLVRPDRMNCGKCNKEVEFSDAYKVVGHRECSCGKLVVYSETAVTENKDKRAKMLRKL